MKTARMKAAREFIFLLGVGCIIGGVASYDWRLAAILFGVLLVVGAGIGIFKDVD